jgi:hypothetical protein
MNNIEQKRAKHLQYLDIAANWLDSKFRIPFTQIRFGLDAIVGFVPYAGDITGFFVSLLLIYTMIRYGISISVFFKMIFNIILDMLIGIIPILGDFLDISYRSNRRNVYLLRQYYEQNPNPPSAKWAFGLFGGLLLSIVILTIWLIWTLSAWMLGTIWHLIGTLFS